MFSAPVHVDQVGAASERSLALAIACVERLLIACRVAGSSCGRRGRADLIVW